MSPFWSLTADMTTFGLLLCGLVSFWRTFEADNAVAAFAFLLVSCFGAFLVVDEGIEMGISAADWWQVYTQGE